MEIYLDLENTLLNQEKTLSQEGVEVLKKLSEKHRVIVLTTGILLEAKLLFSIPNLEIISTLENKLYKNSTYEYQKMDTDILRQCLDSPWIYTLYGVTGDTTYILKYQERMKNFYPTPKIKICNAFPNSVAAFVIAIYKEGLEEIRKVLKDFKLVTLALDSKKVLLLASNTFSTKEAWLLKLKESPAIAIGDSYSDYEFIKHCEVQVAMKNGEDELKALCKYQTTKTNQDNGALDFIFTYLEHQQA